MNSVDFFSSLPGEAVLGLRSDNSEKNYLILKSRIDEKILGEVLIDINGETTSAGPNAQVTVDLPNPENIFIFFFGCLAPSETGLIPSELEDVVKIIEKFIDFGDYTIIIKNANEFYAGLAVLFLSILFYTTLLSLKVVTAK